MLLSHNIFTWHKSRVLYKIWKNLGCGRKLDNKLFRLVMFGISVTNLRECSFSLTNWKEATNTIGEQNLSRCAKIDGWYNGTFK